MADEDRAIESGQIPLRQEFERKPKMPWMQEQHRLSSPTLGTKVAHKALDSCWHKGADFPGLRLSKHFDNPTWPPSLMLPAKQTEPPTARSGRDPDSQVAHDAGCSDPGRDSWRESKNGKKRRRDQGQETETEERSVHGNSLRAETAQGLTRIDDRPRHRSQTHHWIETHTHSKGYCGLQKRALKHPRLTSHSAPARSAGADRASLDRRGLGSWRLARPQCPLKPFGPRSQAGKTQAGMKRRRKMAHDSRTSVETVQLSVTLGPQFQRSTGLRQALTSLLA